MGATRLRGVADRKRDVGDQEGGGEKDRDSKLGETAESQPQERRNRPSSHSATI